MNKRTEVGVANPFLCQSLVHQSWGLSEIPSLVWMPNQGCEKEAGKKRDQRVALASSCFDRCYRGVSA